MLKESISTNVKTQSAIILKEFFFKSVDRKYIFLTKNFQAYKSYSMKKM